MNDTFDFDLIVIGGGIAGMVAAVTATGLGKRVAVIEKSRIGGNCTNSTCIPSKALIRLSHVSGDMARFAAADLLASPARGLTSRGVMPHIGRIIRRAYEKDAPDTFGEMGVDIIHGSATFIDGRRIEVGGRTLSAPRFVIATGTVPFIPPVEGLREVDFLTNETLYGLDDLPESLIILGGGVDGLEYASAFSLLGVQTTVVEMATRLLPMIDLELVRHLLGALKSHGVRLLVGTKVVKIGNRDGKAVLAVERGDGTGEEVVADRVIVAVGRKPDLEGLGLDEAGISYNARGIITDSKLRTSASGIYACGDIAGPYQLASTAEAQGIVAATNAVLPVKRTVDYENNVYVVFTEPPLAYLGLTEEQAYEKFGDKLRVYRFDYSKMRRAIVDGKTTGLGKVLCDGRGRIVGAHILGEEAPEVIHEIQAVKAFRKPLSALNVVTHAYPTYAQALVGRAGQLAFLDEMGSNPWVRLALRLLPGCANRLHMARDRLAETKTAGSTQERDDALAPALIPLREVVDEQASIIESREAGDDSVIVSVRGTLDRSCEKTLSAACGCAVGQSKHLLFDLGDLSRTTPEGIGLLVTHAAAADRNNLAVGAMRLTDPLRDLFRLTGLDDALGVYKDEKEAAQGRKRPRKGPSVSLTGPPFRGTPLPGWAASVDRLLLEDIPARTMNINVSGRRTTGPAHGFGRLWDKRYRLRLADQDIDPRQVVSLWKTSFAEFWPRGNQVFTSRKAPIAPGTAALLNLSLPGGLTLATGIMVIYVDETSFSFTTVEGHMLSGWITFSSFREGGATLIQVHPLFRPGDPLMELAFRLGASEEEDRFWHRTLNNLARRLGSHGAIEQQSTLIDGRLNWKRKGNIRNNAPIRSSLYMPLYLVRKTLQRKE